jgi:O-antigen ligase
VFVLLAPARPALETLRGRLYIWSVAAPHALAHPLTGGGPGSFVVHYPEWEAERLRAGADEDARRFAAAQRHAHNDYLEVLVTLGPLGLAAWLAVAVAALGGLRSRAAPGEDSLRGDGRRCVRPARRGARRLPVPEARRDVRVLDARGGAVTSEVPDVNSSCHVGSDPSEP